MKENEIMCNCGHPDKDHDDGEIADRCWANNYECPCRKSRSQVIDEFLAPLDGLNPEAIKQLVGAAQSALDTLGFLQANWLNRPASTDGAVYEAVRKLRAALAAVKEQTSGHDL